MTPILRSVVGQCYRRGGGRSIGFRQAARNFSSSLPPELTGVRKASAWCALRAFPVAAGYGVGALFISRSKTKETAKHVEKLQEELREVDEIIKEVDQVIYEDMSSDSG